MILGKDYRSVLVADLGSSCLPVEYGGDCSCAGGCCPIPTGPGYAAGMEQEGEEESFTLKAGMSYSIELPYAPEEGEAEGKQAMEAFWSLDLASRDVDFSVSLHPTPSSEPHAPVPTPIIVQEVTRIQAAKQPLIGSYAGDKAGLLYLTVSNAYSKWNSKSVKLRSGTRPRSKQ